MILLPSPEQTAIVNSQRGEVADNMALCGQGEAELFQLDGSCSTDLLRVSNGRLASEQHAMDMRDSASTLANTMFAARFVGSKPRTTTGMTGITHEKGGPEAYTAAAGNLVGHDIRLASEIMSETDRITMLGYMSLVWIGAREVGATGPRYLVRPTEHDKMKGIEEVPTLVKSGQNGSLEHTINALNTIMSEEVRTRTIITPNGLETVETYANPHVGVILRGSDTRPQGDLADILYEEFSTARQELDERFGKNRVPVFFDISHGHAKWEGGGEAGQLKVGEALASLMITGAGISGVMAETYIHSGKQAPDGQEPGLSITDPCIGQDKATQLMLHLDKAHAEGRSRVMV